MEAGPRSAARTRGMTIRCRVRPAFRAVRSADRTARSADRVVRTVPLANHARSSVVSELSVIISDHAVHDWMGYRNQRMRPTRGRGRDSRPCSRRYSRWTSRAYSSHKTIPTTDIVANATAGWVGSPPGPQWCA